MAVTREDMEAAKKSVEFLKVGKKTTVCVLTCWNGFEIVTSSACVVAENYSQELGERYSLERAENKLFELLAFQVQTDLMFDITHNEPESGQDDIPF